MPADRRSLLLILGGIACLTCTAVRAGADDKATTGGEQPAKTAPAEYRRPHLVALTWQNADRSKAQEVQPAWRPDGEQIDAEESKWLHKDLRRFDTQPFSPLTLRPLILVFQIDERSKSPQQLKVTVIANGKRFEQSSWGDSSKSFLSKSAVTTPTSLLREWPLEVDVEVRVPVAEPEMVKRIETLPADRIQLDRGVQWYVDPAGGAEFKTGRFPDDDLPGPAFIFQVDRAEADPLVEYTWQFRLNDKNFQMRSFSIRAPDGKRTEVKQIISNDPSIKFIQFDRQRHRIERYEKVRLRTDLFPN